MARSSMRSRRLSRPRLFALARAGSRRPVGAFRGHARRGRGGGVRRLGRRLAGVSRQRRGARLSEAAFPADHPLERRPEELRRKQPAAWRRIRPDPDRRGNRLLQARPAQFRISAGARWRGRDREGASCCTSRKACSTTMCPANRMGIASAWIDRRHDKPGGGATIVPRSDAALRFPLYVDARARRRPPRRAGLVFRFRSGYGEGMHRALRLTIDRAAIQANWRWLAERAGVPAGAAVKADGYGLGARETTEALLEAGCRDFFVSTWAEAEALGNLPAEASLVGAARRRTRRCGSGAGACRRGRCSTAPSRSRGGRRSRRAARAT